MASSFSKAFTAAFEKAMAERKAEATRDRERALDKKERDEYRWLDKADRESVRAEEREQQLQDILQAAERQKQAALVSEQAVQDRVADSRRYALKQDLLSKGADPRELDTYVGEENDFALSLLEEDVKKQYGEGLRMGREPISSELLDEFDKNALSTKEEYDARKRNLKEGEVMPSYVSPGMGRYRAAGVRSAMDELSRNKLALEHAQSISDITTNDIADKDAANLRALASANYDKHLDFTGLNNTQASEMTRQYYEAVNFRADQERLGAKLLVDLGGDKFVPSPKDISEGDTVEPERTWFKGPPSVAQRRELADLKIVESDERAASAAAASRAGEQANLIKSITDKNGTPIFTYAEVRSMYDGKSYLIPSRVAELHSELVEGPSTIVDGKEVRYWRRREKPLPAAPLGGKPTSSNRGEVNDDKGQAAVETPSVGANVTTPPLNPDSGSLNSVHSSGANVRQGVGYPKSLDEWRTLPARILEQRPIPSHFAPMSREDYNPIREIESQRFGLGLPPLRAPLPEGVRYLNPYDAEKERIIRADIDREQARRSLPSLQSDVLRERSEAEILRRMRNRDPLSPDYEHPWRTPRATKEAMDYIRSQSGWPFQDKIGAPSTRRFPLDKYLP